MRIQILILGFKGLTNIFIDEHQELVPAFFFYSFYVYGKVPTITPPPSQH